METEKVEKIDYSKRAEELRKHIIGYDDFPVEEVEVPEWNLPFPIYIRTMSARERDLFESTQLVENGKGGRELSLDNLRASMLVSVICADPEGRFRIFNDKKDVIELGKKSVAAIDRCLEVSRRLNGSSKKDEEALLKNSEGQEETSG